VAEVVLQNIYKTYTPRDGESGAVLRRIDLTVKDGEFMVLVGPSGCGKSTLLRSIAGLEQVTAGTIQVGDRLVNDLPPKARDIAMVFQSYALYPHLKVYDNIAFGLRRRSLEQDKSGIGAMVQNFAVETTRNLPLKLRYESDRERRIRQQVYKVAEMLQIEGLLQRLPKQLSGGQKQRVALGRAIARDAQVFLMDEPLSNLDAKLRAETRSQIVRLQRQLGKTTIYVTHDQTEAMTMGDRIAVMYGGQIQQVAPPLEIYQRPANTFVAQFIGSPPMNFLPVRIQSDMLVNGDWQLPLIPSQIAALRDYSRRDVILGIRAEHLSLGGVNNHHWQGRVELVEALGTDTYISVELKGLEKTGYKVQARLPADRPVSIGQDVWLALAIDKLHLFNPETTAAIPLD
jgi:multiple sugar transport system ATP-binding protein